MTNYDPFRPIPQTKPRPNEKLWEVWARPKLFSCELKYHGEFAVEAQIFENGDLLVGRRFETRQLAVNWAMLEKEDMQKAATDGRKDPCGDAGWRASTRQFPG